jgi:hypothetical protein
MRDGTVWPCGDGRLELCDRRVNLPLVKQGLTRLEVLVEVIARARRPTYTRRG